MLDSSAYEFDPLVCENWQIFGGATHRPPNSCAFRRHYFRSIEAQLRKQAQSWGVLLHDVQSKLINPATLIVVTQARAEDPFRNTEDYAATCCAIQNMMLAATAEGLGSKWSTGALTKHPDVCDILDIDIEAEDVVGFVWVGVPLKVPTIERPALETHVKVLS